MAFAGAAHRFRKICTSMAFWLPSGCVIPVEPTNMPGLMSAIDDFTIATNSGLSVTVNLTSAPSRFLITINRPLDPVDGAADADGFLRRCRQRETDKREA